MKKTTLARMLMLCVSTSGTFATEYDPGLLDTVGTSNQLTDTHIERELTESIYLLGSDRVDDVSLDGCIITITVLEGDDCPLCDKHQLDAVTRNTTIIDLTEMTANPVSGFRPSILPNAMIMSFRVGKDASLAYTEIGKNVSVREDSRGTVFVDQVAQSRRSEDILEKFEITSRVNYDTRKYEGLVRILGPNASFIVRKDSNPELPHIVNEYASLFCNSKE